MSPDTWLTSFDNQDAIDWCHVTVVTSTIHYHLCLVFVLLQFLSKKLGVDPIMFGYLETIFSISLLIGGPLFGRFGDLFGARAALTMALFSAFLTYATLAVSSNILMLFLSRLPGVLMHVMHGK